MLNYNKDGISYVICKIEVWEDNDGLDLSHQKFSVVDSFESETDALFWASGLLVDYAAPYATFYRICKRERGECV